MQQRLGITVRSVHPDSAPDPVAAVEVSGDDSSVPLCGSDDLTVRLHWQEGENHSLRGEVLAENVGPRACRLGMKPGVRPLASDGKPLAAECIQTLEMVYPSHVLLQPGEQARASVAWSGWCGEPASGQTVVSWDGGSALVQAQGPRQPGCDEERPQNLSSDWFRKTR